MPLIVVMDDDAGTRMLVSQVLKKEGFEVLMAADGAIGLDLIRQHHPDLVVSDVEMPKINGFEVLSDMRTTPETAQTPVILLTSRSSQEDISHGLAQGANAYLTKPFDPAKLTQTVNQLLELNAERLGAAFDAKAPVELTLLPHEPITPYPTLDPVQSAESTAGRRDRHADPLAHLPRQQFGAAWAVSMEVHNDSLLREMLPTQAWRALLRQLFLPVSRDAALRTADYLDLHESRLILYYLDQAIDGKPGYVRAAQAVQAMLRSGHHCKQWAAAQFQGAGVPAVRVLTSLHLGPIDVVRVPLDFGGERDTVVGPTAEFMQRLRSSEPRVMWRVLGTDSAVAASAHAYRLGAQMALNVGSQEVRVHALQDMHPALSQGEQLDASAWI